MSEASYRSLFDLTGKRAIVTGGAGILGRRFCAGLADFGADVAIVDLDKDAARDLANEIASRYGVNTCFRTCDVSDPAAVEAMVADVFDTFGSIKILHNNAAAKPNDLSQVFTPLEEYSPTQWRDTMAVNIDGMFYVAQAVGKRMARQSAGGSIIQTASIYGIMGPDQRIYEGSNYMGREINTPPVYSASKAAVVGLTRHLATYWAGQGVRVNTLTPGGVESGQNETFKQRYGARVPMGRMARADEMVGALVYLASDASSYVTGHNLVVDGGLHAW